MASTPEQIVAENIQHGASAPDQKPSLEVGFTAENSIMIKCNNGITSTAIELDKKNAVSLVNCISRAIKDIDRAANKKSSKK